MGTVISQNDLLKHRQVWKNSGEIVVLSCGQFDVLHPGHIRLLEQARLLGDIVVVGVESDSSAGAGARRRIGAVAKTSDLPLLTPGAERAEILAALAAVDYVVEFSDYPPDGLRARLQPDIVIEGGTADPSETQADAVVEASGSKIVRVPLEPGYSTTWLIDRIRHIPA